MSYSFALGHQFKCVSATCVWLIHPHHWRSLGEKQPRNQQEDIKKKKCIQARSACETPERARVERHKGADKSLSFLTFRRSRIIIYFLFSFIILEKCCRRIKTSLLVSVGQMIFRIMKVAWNRFNESHLTFICLLNAAWNTHTKSIFDCRNKCTGFCTRVPIPARSFSPTAKCGTGRLIQYLCHFSLHSVGYNYVMRLRVCGHYL